MNISYNWLRDYIRLDESPEQLAEILTALGLEVEAVDEVESIRGGLRGLVVGRVAECADHPNSDHLHITKVDIGQGEPLDIVCGAPNVAAGQKVIVATIGTKLYDGDKEFEIRRSKIRGQESMGMICAEDEIGVGASHDGIMVLPPDTPVGMPASQYFGLESDFVFTIGLTPNRVDAASHMGVARDLAAYFALSDARPYTLPDVSAFAVDSDDNRVSVRVDDSDGCFRYAGITLDGLTVGPSPEWLCRRLRAIGLNPINNLVDVTNFVLHELGQPLHAFDLDHVADNQIVVRTYPAGTEFVTLDNVARKLSGEDLMICDSNEPMCMAGVFGGAKSGINDKTTRVFIESAWFNPVRIRKTARRHGLSTDASFRYERGTDPNIVLVALKRAAMLMKEVAGGRITSQIIDVYPSPCAHFEVPFSVDRFNALVGEEIPADSIRKILSALEIKVADTDTEGNWNLFVPPYRVDVQRFADIAEEVLRVYGYNNIAMGDHLRSTVIPAPALNPEHVADKVSDMLTAAGYSEMMNNSITKSAYFEQYDYFDNSQIVRILNPLSSDLNCMRRSLLFGALETLRYNVNRQCNSLKFFELGKVYSVDSKGDPNQLSSYSEGFRIALAITGNRTEPNWNQPETPSSFFDIKSTVESLFKRLGIKNLDVVESESVQNDICREGLLFTYQKRELGFAWILRSSVSKSFDIPSDVFYAELDWDFLLKLTKQGKTLFTEIPRFPSVRRDLALVVDKQMTFSQLKAIALKAEKQLLKSVGLFDVYEGDKIDAAKKSYAICFILQDKAKTLDDKQIEKSMTRILSALQREAGAVLR